MAVSTDPLRRDAIGVVASLPTARLQAPVTNSALQLAEALRNLTPEAEQAMASIAKTRAEKAREQAQKDALEQSGALLADAVRAGKLKPTQNPWYTQAYNREAAAIRAQDALQQLQTESASWAESSDPQAFRERWRAEVGDIAKSFEGPDLAAGFTAAEAAVTSQVLQTNVAKAAARIQAERTQNLGALAVDALQSALRAKGGALSPNEAFEALLPARQQWFATGGDADGWNKLVVSSVTSTAYSAKDKYLLDLLKAPELVHGPSEAGGVDRIGSGQGYTGAVVSPIENPVPPPPWQAPSPTLRTEAPLTKLAPPVTGGVLKSGFGQRKAPIKGASTYHEGLDIALPQGSPVKAQATGKVVFAGAVKGYGNQVRVDYGNGVVASYSHLSGFSVKEGDLVAAGQTVAAVGKTGVATGPHLHYMLEVNGKRVDPRTFKGDVGGTFEGGPADAAPAESLVGFPGQDQPFTAGNYQTPANQYGRGPSLYGMPGVADQVESDRYRISEAAMAATTERMRQVDQQRTVRGYQAQDYLLNKYGTGMLTGAVTRDTIIKELNTQGYSAPEIAKALNLIRDSLTDSVGVTNAQIAARQQEPGKAKDILGLQVRVATQGYSPGMEDELGALVMSGDLSGEDAKQLIVGAISRSKQIEAEAKADVREARADERWRKSQQDVASYGDLKEQAQIAADYMVNLASQSDPRNEIVYRDERTRRDWQGRVQTAMGAYLQAHPKDFEGALQAGKQAAADYLRVILRRGRKPAAGNTQPAPQGGNPRR